MTERAEAGRPDAAPATECVLTDLSYQSRRLTVNYRFWQLLSLSHITEGEYLQRVFLFVLWLLEVSRLARRNFLSRYILSVRAPGSIC